MTIADYSALSVLIVLAVWWAMRVFKRRKSIEQFWQLARSFKEELS
jgi:hypothetical protein